MKTVCILNVLLLVIAAVLGLNPGKRSSNTECHAQHLPHTSGPHSGTLYCITKEDRSEAGDNMDEPWSHCARGHGPFPKTQGLYDSIFKKYGTIVFIEAESRMVTLGGWAAGTSGVLVFDGYFWLSTPWDLKPPWEHTSGCVCEGICRKILPRRKDPLWVRAAPSDGATELSTSLPSLLPDCDGETGCLPTLSLPFSPRWTVFFPS